MGATDTRQGFDGFGGFGHWDDGWAKGSDMAHIFPDAARTHQLSGNTKKLGVVLHPTTMLADTGTGCQMGQ